MRVCIEMWLKRGGPRFRAEVVLAYDCIVTN